MALFLSLVRAGVTLYTISGISMPSDCQITSSRCITCSASVSCRQSSYAFRITPIFCSGAFSFASSTGAQVEDHRCDRHGVDLKNLDEELSDRHVLAPCSRCIELDESIAALMRLCLTPRARDHGL